MTLGFGWIGWVDDYRKVVHHDPKGMSAKEKFGWQSLIGIIASVYLAFAISAPNDIHVVHMLIGWIESGFPMQMPPHADLIIPFFKALCISPRDFRLYRVDFYCDCRNKQCGEFD